MEGVLLGNYFDGVGIMKKSFIAIICVFICAILSGCERNLELGLIKHDDMLISFERVSSIHKSEDQLIISCIPVNPLPYNMSEIDIEYDRKWIAGLYAHEDSKNMMVKNLFLYNGITNSILECKGNEYIEDVELFRPEDNLILVQTPYEIYLYDMSSCQKSKNVLNTNKANYYRGISWNPENSLLIYSISLNYTSDVHTDEIREYDLINLTDTLISKGKYPSWSESGEELAFFSETSLEIMTSSYESYIRIPLGKQDAHRRSTISWNPSGEKVLISYHQPKENKNDGGKIFVYEFHSSTLSLIDVGGENAVWFPDWICGD